MPETKSNYEASKGAIKRYLKENIVKLGVNLNKATDGDVIDWLSAQPNKRQYVLGLIRKDMGKKD